MLCICFSNQRLTFFLSFFFEDGAHHSTSYHSKCANFTLSPFLTLAYDIPFSSSLFKSPATFIWSMVFHLFTFRLYLTFEKAVTLILKHATFLRNSNGPQSALTYAELDYQKANIDVTIQQHLITHGPEHSVEQFAGFIMSTDIGLCILPFLTFISYHPFSSSTTWLKNLEPKSHEASFLYWELKNVTRGKVGPMSSSPVVSIVKPCIVYMSKFWCVVLSPELGFNWQLKWHMSVLFTEQSQSKDIYQRRLHMA